MKITKSKKQCNHTSESAIQTTLSLFSHPVKRQSHFKDYITSTAKPTAHKTKHDVHFVFCYIQQQKQRTKHHEVHLLITTVQVTKYSVSYETYKADLHS
jgi:hypothetical protein